MNKIKAKFSMMLGGSDNKYFKALMTEGTERSGSKVGVTATLKTSQSTAAQLFGGSKNERSSKSILIKKEEPKPTSTKPSNPIGELMAIAKQKK